MKALKQAGGQLYSIDLQLYEWVIETTKKLKDEPVVFIKGDSVEVGRAWDKGDIDILLCDSDHSKERVLNELEAWTKYNPKIIFIHDLFFPDGSIAPPFEAVKEFAIKTGRPFSYNKCYSPTGTPGWARSPP